MVPGTDRYRESRVERQGGDEERGRATAKSREKKRERGGRWSGRARGVGGDLKRRWESVDVARWR